jgi:Right handed beta helix region
MSRNRIRFRQVQTEAAESFARALSNLMVSFKSLLLILFLSLTLAGCTESVIDNTEMVQHAVSVGGTVTFPAGTYVITKTITVNKSHTIIAGDGPETVFVFRPRLPHVQCANDRAFTTPCDVVFSSRRQITDPISIGDTQFSAASDVSDLNPGDWLIVEEKDHQAGETGEVIAIDWAQVKFASGTSVSVQLPFRSAFSNVREWDPDHSGLGFYKIPNLIEGVEFRNLRIIVPDAGQGTPGISVFAAKNVVVDNVSVDDSNGQPLYSYLSKDLVIRNSSAECVHVLNEFAATVDLVLTASSFSCSQTAGVGLDFGTGFFQVFKNDISHSANDGIYLLNGVHDGALTSNSISFVRFDEPGISNGNAVGILARGISRVDITQNYLAGGAGINSIGISVGTAYHLDFPISCVANVIEPNVFGPSWGMDYDPSNPP